MPSGPKKRMKLRRKKQGSPATDANSDRETEGLSISGSMDVDELDVDDVDTPTPVKSGDRRARPTFDDKDAVSSQTEEWVRVSDFDVGTPTSQTGENEPLSEDVDISSVRRSLDKLAEWESVSGDNIPERKDGSANSLEEEPSEVEVEESAPEGASGHSSESFTHLPSPQPIQEKDSDIDRRSVRSDSSSSSSSSSSSNSDAHSKPPAAAVIEEVDASRASDSEPGEIPPPSYASVKAADEGEEDKEIVKHNGDPVEKEVVHEGHESSSLGDTSVPEEREMKVDEAVKAQDSKPQSVDISEAQEMEGKAAEDPVVELKPPTSASGVPLPEEKTADETISAASPVEEKEITSSGAKDISEVDTPLDIQVETPSTAGAPDEDKEVLSQTEESRIPSGHVHLPGDDEKVWLEAALSGEKTSGPSILDVVEDVRSEDKEVASLPSDDKHEETKSIPSPEPSAVTAAEDKEVASTSAETEEAKKVSADTPEFESVVRIHETKPSSGDQTELTVDQVSLKPLAPPSDQAGQQQAVVEERHLTVDITQPAAVKNGIVAGNLRPHMEQKSLSGCCGVIYWLLGREH